MNLDMLLPEAGAIYVVDYVATSCFAGAYTCSTKPGPSSSRVPSRTSMLRRLFGADGSLDRHRRCRPEPSAWTASTPGRYYPELLRRIQASRTPSPARRWSSSPTTSRFRGAATTCALYKRLAGGTLLQVDPHLRIKQFHGTSENAVDADLDCRLGLRPSPLSRSASTWTLALHFVTDPLGHPLRENAHASSTCGRDENRSTANNQPIEFISIFNRTLV